MSAMARRALTVAFAIAGFFQIATAADAQSGSSPQQESAASVQRAKGPLEILLSQHQQHKGVNASTQAKTAVPSASLPAVATAPMDDQPSAPAGTANDVRKNGVATTSATPVAAPVSPQATSLGRELPAVSNQSKELSPPTNNGGESN